MTLRFGLLQGSSYPGFFEEGFSTGCRSKMQESGVHPQPLMNFMQIKFDLAINFNNKINTVISFKQRLFALTIGMKYSKQLWLAKTKYISKVKLQ